MKKSIKVITKGLIAFAIAAIMGLSTLYAATPVQETPLTYDEIASLRLELFEELLAGLGLTEESDIFIAYIEMINFMAEMFDFDAALIGLLMLEDFLEFLDGGDSLFEELFMYIMAARYETSGH